MDNPQSIREVQREELRENKRQPANITIVCIQKILGEVHLKPALNPVIESTAFGGSTFCGATTTTEVIDFLAIYFFD